MILPSSWESISAWQLLKLNTYAYLATECHFRPAFIFFFRMHLKTITTHFCPLRILTKMNRKRTKKWKVRAHA